ncbi:unnamed protein product [Durusdinium trenchii]|uniref:Uncharacterized protein n=1 Tax=Durusdinium trenchii TaxID=1381693 RepID=A0ABP0IYS7_9DINO
MECLQDTSLMQNTEWKMLEEFGSAPIQRKSGCAVIETSGKLWGYGGSLGSLEHGAPLRAGTFGDDLYWLDTTGPAPTTATSTTTRHPKDLNPNHSGGHPKDPNSSGGHPKDPDSSGGSTILASRHAHVMLKKKTEGSIVQVRNLPML